MTIENMTLKQHFRASFPNPVRFYLYSTKKTQLTKRFELLYCKKKGKNSVGNLKKNVFNLKENLYD